MCAPAAGLTNVQDGPGASLPLQSLGLVTMSCYFPSMSPRLPKYSCAGYKAAAFQPHNSPSRTFFWDTAPGFHLCKANQLLARSSVLVGMQA